MTLFRRRRLARIHMDDPAPSFEGILLGRWGGHYHLIHAKLVEAADQSRPLDGTIELPAERVVFVQVLPS